MKKFLVHMLMTLPAVLVLTGFGSLIFRFNFSISTQDPVLILGSVASAFFSIVAAITSLINAKSVIYKIFSVLSHVLAAMLLGITVFFLVEVL